MRSRTSPAWRKITRAAELLSLFSIGVTLPIGVAEFYIDRKEEMRHRIEDHYDQLDQRYIDFEKLCLDNITLDCADTPILPTPDLSQEDRLKQQLLYNILLSILERAYLKYQVERLNNRLTQWEGWDDYVSGFAARKAFRDVWKNQGDEYDECFQDYMDAKVHDAERADPIPAARTVTNNCEN
jgi:hypothetical protein